MILAVNIGNTHISFCCIKNDNISKIYKIITNKNETVYGYAASLHRIFELEKINCEDFEGAIISSVVPPVTEIFKEAVKTLCNKTPLIVGAGIKTGLHIKIDDPGTIAADLVIGAVAAKEHYPLPCAIVDMGTATTITVVDGDGKYIGGTIMPGVSTSLDALTLNTSLLPHIEIKPPQKNIPTNTVDSMKSGIIFGSAGAVDKVLGKFEEEIGELKTVVSTGGMADIIAPYCTHKINSDEKLLFKGLNIIYKKN